MDVKLIKIKLTQDNYRDFLDGDIFITPTENKFPYGESLNANIKKVPDKKSRSYEQLCLYKQALKFVAFNSPNPDWGTPDKVDIQIKIVQRYMKGWIYHENSKTGEKMIQVIPKSVSYDELKHLEACDFFSKAFRTMSLFLGMEEEHFIREVKESIGQLNFINWK
jgi:hypothetical protein